MNARQAAWQGVRRSLALAAGAFPFGIAAGIAATEAGWSPLQAAFMSIGVFAGAAQLAVLELSTTGASIGMLVLVAVVINSRLVLYSAGLSRAFSGHSLLRKLGLAYLLTDHAYALTVARHEEPEGHTHDTAFYLGVGLTLWCAWQLGTVVGATVGMGAPPALGVDFAAPLAFIALAVPACRGRTNLATAAASLCTYFLVSGLPASFRLMTAVAVGLAVGAFLDRER
ncbi:MAG: AzlC family ABC transporter permease [Myxococcota bacterium]